MPSTPLSSAPATTPLAAPLPAVRRLFGRWWRRQSPSRQDRFATLGPLLSVLLFLAAIISAFWYLRNEEVERETESVQRDTELTQQQIGLRLIQNQETLIRMARDLVVRETRPEDFLAQAAAFARERPEVTHLSWLDARRRPRASHSALPYNFNAAGDTPEPALPVEGRPSEPETTFRTARDTRSPAYSRGFTDNTGAAAFQLHLPLVERSTFAGVIIVEYSVDSLVRHFVPADVAQRHMISVVDENQRLLSATVTPMPGGGSARAAIVSDAPLTPALNGLLLRGQGWRTSIGHRLRM